MRLIRKPRAYTEPKPDILGYKSLKDWLAFLNTVRTERFDQVLSLQVALPKFAVAA
jgi:ADP-heptose:LPS heptosyltransferase